MNNNQNVKSENVIAGIVGAFLFSLAGAAVWVVLDLIGFYAGISGLVGAVCAIQGYRIFSGKLSKKGVIIAAVIALLVLVLAWYGCFVKDLYQAYQEWYANGEVDYAPTYFECFRVGYSFLSEPEIAGQYFIGLLMGIGFAVIGSVRYIINAFRSVDTPAPAAYAPQAQQGYNEVAPDSSASYSDQSAQMQNGETVSQDQAQSAQQNGFTENGENR